MIENMVKRVLRAINSQVALSRVYNFLACCSEIRANEVIEDDLLELNKLNNEPADNIIDITSKGKVNVLNNIEDFKAIICLNKSIDMQKRLEREISRLKDKKSLFNIESEVSNIESNIVFKIVDLKVLEGEGSSNLSDISIGGIGKFDNRKEVFNMVNVDYNPLVVGMMNENLRLEFIKNLEGRATSLKVNSPINHYVMQSGRRLNLKDDYEGIQLNSLSELYSLFMLNNKMLDTLVFDSDDGRYSDTDENNKIIDNLKISLTTLRNGIPYAKQGLGNLSYSSRVLPDACIKETEEVVNFLVDERFKNNNRDLIIVPDFKAYTFTKENVINKLQDTVDLDEEPMNGADSGLYLFTTNSLDASNSKFGGSLLSYKDNLGRLSNIRRADISPAYTHFSNIYKNKYEGVNKNAMEIDMRIKRAIGDKLIAIEYKRVNLSLGVDNIDCKIFNTLSEDGYTFAVSGSEVFDINELIEAFSNRTLNSESKTLKGIERVFKIRKNTAHKNEYVNRDIHTISLCFYRVKTFPLSIFKEHDAVFIDRDMNLFLSQCKDVNMLKSFEPDSILSRGYMLVNNVRDESLYLTMHGFVAKVSSRKVVGMDNGLYYFNEDGSYCKIPVDVYEKYGIYRSHADAVSRLSMNSDFVKNMDKNADMAKYHYNRMKYSIDNHLAKMRFEFMKLQKSDADAKIKKLSELLSEAKASKSDDTEAFENYLDLAGKMFKLLSSGKEALFF